MKKNLLRGLFTACLTIACTLTASAKVYLTEDFQYEATTLHHTEASSTGWLRFGSHGDSPVALSLSDGGLVYAGYQDVAKGKKAVLGVEKSSERLFKAFNNKDQVIYEANKNLYYAALINVTSAPASAPNFFMEFSMNGSSGGDLLEGKTGTELAKLFAQHSAEGKYKLALSRYNTTLSEFTAELDYGTTYLVVVKYTFVDGSTNDIVTLYVNPSSAAEPTTADAIYNASSGSDASTSSGRGIVAIVLYQGQTGTRNASALSVDAIRVADTWSDLFPAAGGGSEDGDGNEGEEGGDTGATPMLECGVLAGGELSSSAQLDGAVVGEEITCTLHIAGKDLKGDITLTTTDADILSINPSSVSKADAEAGGKEVIVTIKPSSSMFTQYTITASSEKAEDFPISIYCMAQQPPYQSLQAFIDDFAGEESSYYDYTVQSDMVVTHVFQQNSNWCAYIQDATAGVRVYDAYASMQSYKTGDRIADLNGALEYSFGVYSINTNNAPYNPTVIKNEPAEPIAIGIADMPNYVGRLVRINNVAIATANNKTTITAGEATAELTTFSGSDVEIAALPAEADLIGIVRSANATVRRISPRSKADIISRVASNLNNITTSKVWAADGALYIQGAEDMQVEVLNVAGQTILTKAFAAGTHTVALDGGMYLVKVNGTVEKLIVR